MDELENIKRLAGVGSYQGLQPYSVDTQENVSYTAHEKSKYQKKKNIKPGTEEWFRLWFARPYLTGEKPFD